MPDRAKKTHLTLADKHIAEGEERIGNQLRLIEHLTADGQSIEKAFELLAVLMQTLHAMQHHRSLILKSLDESD
ncbi:hypothetical protein [Noviherbaspirillum pedocola]|uniref:Uncharacterized protein n=1 Tax=Noviherbaspirillum pedocola TaxID=2801341 RepID=A0A934SWA8_9BURK|nr:hypothetical protein [Noviherbaspirillum pedocola]MBK4736804.1 hypothetical protein [Noviherbaspirillum pedocola]